MTATARAATSSKTPSPRASASLRILSAALLFSLLAAPGYAKDPAPGPAKPAKPAKQAGATGDARADAIVRALRRLDEDVATNERDMNEQHRIFTTSIAGLCFLLDPTGGKGTVHADRLEKALDAIGQYVDGAAAQFDSKARPGDDLTSMMWSQTTWSLGAAAILYAELIARGQKKADATKRLRVIADLLVRSQQPDGGFGHDRQGRPRIPEIELPGGTKIQYPATLLSASNWASMGIGLARPVGGKRLDAAVANARAYYAASACTGGCYPYDPSQKESGGFDGDVTAAARTAGSYCALRALGVPARDKALQRTQQFLERRVEELPEGHGSSPHGVFFGALATLEIGGKARGEFEKTILPRILAAQDEATGAFDCVCKHSFGTTCESFKSSENVAMQMMGGGGEWKSWVRAYVNALNLFALLAEKGRLKLLDGLPADAGPAAETTPSVPGDDSAMGGAASMDGEPAMSGGPTPAKPEVK